MLPNKVTLEAFIITKPLLYEMLRNLSKKQKKMRKSKELKTYLKK